MATAPDATARSVPGPSAIDDARRLFRAAEELGPLADRGRQLEAYKAYLAFVESRRRTLEEAGGEIAARLDDVAMALYRAGQAELATRAVEVGLSFAPGSSALLHHKALVLLAQNRRVEDVLPLLDRAVEANPHDKGIWATRGDALRILSRPAEAAEAYLRAQQLDPTSTQYVERALKIAPDHPAALRMKLQLARARGGDRQALEACDALLAAHPKDAELLLARVELLASLGQLEEGLRALAVLRAVRPDEPRIALLNVRLLFDMGHPERALPEVRRLLEERVPIDGPMLSDFATATERSGQDPALAFDLRRKLLETDPRNLANLQSIRALALELKRVDAAIDASRHILEISPGNLDGLRALADLYLSAGKPDEAFQIFREIARTHPNEVGELRKALAAAKRLEKPDLVQEFAGLLRAAMPDDVGAKEELAGSLAATGKKAEALDVYNALLAQTPGNAAYLLEKKRLLVELDRPAELPAVYDELFRVDPTRSDIALERGNLYLAAAYAEPEGSKEREASARAALVSYERASLNREMFAQSWLGLARAARLVQDFDRAIRAYREFLQQPGQQKRGDVHKELGHALREVNRLTEALAAYDEAVALGRDDSDLLWGEVEVQTLLNRESAAFRFLDLLLQREPQNPIFLRRKGQLLLQAGRRVEALAVLKSAVAAARGDPHAHFEVADALRAQGAYADAIGYYQQGLQLDPKSRPGRLALAEALLLAGRYNDVIPQVDQLLHEDPNDLRAWKTRADACRALGRTSEVQYSLKAILLLDPHNAGALLEKYRLHSQSGEKNEAFDTLARALETGGPESRTAELWLEHADLAGELGRVEDANRSYEKAAQIDPAQARAITLRRARLRLAAGRPDLALELLEGAIAAAGPSGPEPAALLLRAEILVALERHAEAQAVYDEVRRRDPHSAPAILGTSRSMLDQGKPAEARDFLRASLPKVPADADLYLLLTEAESALGSLPNAVEAAQKGLEALPRSVPLWVRLGELKIRLEAWPDAANAFAHAIALDSKSPELHLRAGFVAEKLGHAHEALALYERATEVAPANKYAWNARGLALLAVNRPDDAKAAFDRALALDSDFEPAKDGKKAALQKTREGLVERFGREALVLEARLNRGVTKNDLFVTLHVPFDLLEPVLTAIGRSPKIDLDRLSEEELHDLENASYHLITAALEHRPPGIERRGFTLADVAVLSPPTLTLEKIQRLFGYLRSVLELDLRPENLTLSPDVEELARKALLLPENERTLFELVRRLRVGIFKARLIKAVESAGSAVHAPLPSLDLGAYSPEFAGEGAAPIAGGDGASEDPHFWPADDEVDPHVNVVLPAGAPPATATIAPAATSATHGTAARCAGCGGLATSVHRCGAPLCQHCIAQFPTCPKCQQPVPAASLTQIGVPASTAAPVAASPSGPAAKGGRSLKSLLGRNKAAPGKSASGATGSPPAATARPAPARTGPPAHPAGGGHAPPGRTAAGPKTPAPPAPAVAEPPAPPAAKPPAPRERKDEEPRL
jgi:tetratricopeptide (TPR) repeat protein